MLTCLSAFCGTIIESSEGQYSRSNFGRAAERFLSIWYSWLQRQTIRPRLGVNGYPAETFGIKSMLRAYFSVWFGCLLASYRKLYSKRYCRVLTAINPTHFPWCDEEENKNSKGVVFLMSQKSDPVGRDL